MGSKTAEMTALYNHWERTTNNYVLRNAVDMRRIINWFVERDGEVAQSVFNMLKAYREWTGTWVSLSVPEQGLLCTASKTKEPVTAGFPRLVPTC